MSDTESILPIPEGTVHVLGAGFSKALSPNMPLTNQLGDQVLNAVWPELRQPGTPPALEGAGFEVWLSGLAERQPYLTETANADNQADLLHILDEIYEVLCEAQAAALWSMPGWVTTFAALTVGLDASILTFNYDCLLEKSYEGLVTVGVTIPNPTLHKLHGSLDRFWTPRDAISEPVTAPVVETWFGRPAPRIAGRSPFIVPPVAPKSSYYDTQYLRGQWEMAATALSNAERVVLVGYSLPLTDVVVSNMFRRALGQSNAEIVLVNPDKMQVEANLNALGVGSDRIVGRWDSVERYAEAGSIARSCDVARLLRHRLDSTSPVTFRVFGSDATQYPISGVRPSEDSIDIVLGRNEAPTPNVIDYDRVFSHRDDSGNPPFIRVVNELFPQWGSRDFTVVPARGGESGGAWPTSNQIDMVLLPRSDRTAVAFVL